MPNATQRCPNVGSRCGEAQKSFFGVCGRLGKGREGAEIPAISM